MPGPAGLTHNRVSGLSDDVTQPSLVQPSNWDDKHYFTGANLGALLYQGTSGEVQAVNSVALGQVLASVAVGSAPAWTTSPQLTFVKLGGTTSSFPGITFNGTEFQIVLADNSAFTVARALGYIVGSNAGSAGALRVSNAATICTARNAANSGNLHLLATDSSNRLIIGDDGGSGTAIASLLLKSTSSGGALVLFGGTTSSFPALKRSSAELQVRLADDSAFGVLNALSLVVNTGTFLTSAVALTNGAGAGAGTITNAPAAGDPTKWIPINDNGTTRYIPCW